MIKLQENLFSICSLIAFTVLLNSCNYTFLKSETTNSNQAFNLPAEKISQLSYSAISRMVFEPKCVGCHGDSGNIRLETYSEVVRNLDLIKKTVFVLHSMPKKASLTDEEMAYLWNWINLGAPEQAKNGTSLPPPDPLVPSFDSINKHVFQATCIHCHKPDGTGKRVMLDHQSLLNSPLELILPGNPDESGLVVDIERIDEKRMPPAKDGYSALSDQTKQVIRQWIRNGAKD